MYKSAWSKDGFLCFEADDKCVSRLTNRIARRSPTKRFAVSLTPQDLRV
jgi:hypothetical protein